MSGGAEKGGERDLIPGFLGDWGLSSSKHHKKGNFVSIVDGFREFIRVSGSMIYKNLNDIEQLIFLGK
jgi:hypothetical protein